MIRATILCAAAFGLVLRDADPMCKTGIASADLYACCPKSCGACDDANEACTGAGGDVAAQAQGGCCPGQIRNSEDYRQCDLTRPPCQLGDSYRNPAAADALDILANTDRHARDDCNEAIPQATKEMKLNIDYAKKPDKSSGGPTMDCGTYSGKGLEDAAGACTSNEDCVGFTSKDGKPDCLLNAFGAEQNEAGSDLYLKVKNQAGHTVVGGIMEYHAAGGAIEAKDTGLPETAAEPSDIKPVKPFEIVAPGAIDRTNPKGTSVGVGGGKGGGGGGGSRPGNGGPEA